MAGGAARARLQAAKRDRKVTALALTRDFKETIRARVNAILIFARRFSGRESRTFCPERRKSSHLFVGGAFQEFLDECLIGLRPFSSQPTELGEKPRSNADGNQLPGVTGPADAARAAELLVGGFPEYRKGPAGNPAYA